MGVGPVWPEQWTIVPDFLIYGAAYLAVWMAVPGSRAQLGWLLKFLNELRPASN